MALSLLPIALQASPILDKLMEFRYYRNMKTIKQMSDPKAKVALIPEEHLTKELLSNNIWLLNGLSSGSYQLTSGPKRTLEMLEEMFPNLKLSWLRNLVNSSENE